MKKILITIFTLMSLINNAQVCFKYDNAGNQVKRQTCVLAITNQENDELSQVSPEFSTERRSLSEGDDLSELVMYLNPTSSAFQLRDQHIWIGSSLRVVTNERKILQTILISDEPIDMSHLPSGSYFLILSTDVSRKTAKLFITK